MSDAKICDRPVHETIEEALFRGPGMKVQTARGEVELCPACASAFNEWWEPEAEEERADGETIGENLDE